MAVVPARMDRPWSIYSGDPAALTLRVREGFLAVDLSGRTFASQWRRKTSSDTAVTIEVDATDAATGTLVLRLTGEQTAAMSSTGVWDVQEADGTTLIRGTTTWQADVTRV